MSFIFTQNRTNFLANPTHHTFCSCPTALGQSVLFVSIFVLFAFHFWRFLLLYAQAQRVFPPCVYKFTKGDLHSCLVFFYIYINLFILFIYFWLCWVFVAARRAFSSSGERELLFVAVHGLLTAVASLVVEHGSRHAG